MVINNLKLELYNKVLSPKEILNEPEDLIICWFRIGSKDWSSYVPIFYNKKHFPF